MRFRVFTCIPVVSMGACGRQPLTFNCTSAWVTCWKLAGIDAVCRLHR
jgi:hypothetical protein